MESSNSVKIRLTVVGLDLVKSSELTGNLEKITGEPKSVAEFFEKMQKSIHESFCSVMSNPSEYEIFQRLEGDAFRVSFEKADDAYKFVKKLGQDFKDYHNANPEVKKRVFRIGAATGNVYFNKSADEAASNKITSDIVLRKVARLRDVEEKGYFCVDEATYNGFSDDVRNNFSNKLVETKEHEDDISAWCYQVMKADTSEENYVKKQKQSEPVIGEINSPSEEKSKKDFERLVAKSLLLLDYRTQEDEFTSPFHSSKKKGAFFLLKEDEETIKDWLVFRLAKTYNAKIFPPIDFRFYPDILTQGFETAFYKAFDNNELDREGLIEKLIHILVNKKQSVFIITQNIRCYEQRDIKLLLQKLCKFFSDLLYSFQKRANNKNLTSRIIFILVERKNSAVGEIRSYLNNETENNNIINALTVLKGIPNSAICEWLNRSDSFEILKQSNRYDLESVKNKFESCFTDDQDKLSPLLKLDYICSKLFSIENAEIIRPCWRLESICS